MGILRSTPHAGRGHRAVVRVTCLLALAAVGVIFAPANALAAASFSTMDPGVGATLAGSPWSVSVFVDDASKIMESSVISVDGKPLTTSVGWVGHVEDPDCWAIWVIDDYTAATLSAPLLWLGEGTHTVSVTVNTASSGTSTYAWSFTVDFPAGSAAVFSARVPAPGATVTGAPELWVTVDAPNPVYYGNARFYLNGTEFLPTGGVTSRHVVLKSYVPLYTDGLNTMLVRVRDNGGVITEDTWNFTVAVKPTLGSPTPAAGSVTASARPAIGLTIADNSSGPVNVRLRIDGVQVFNGPAPLGLFRWRPLSDLANNSTHVVIADVTDAVGATQTSSWSFQVVAKPAMSPDLCASCHSTYPAEHPMSNCYACHSDGGDHGVGTAPTPAGACLGCHDYYHGWAFISSWSCTTCHTAAYPTVPMHDEAAVDVLHTSPTTGCEECHSSDLPAEHGKYPSDSSFKYQCALCHTSTDPTVTAAIATGNAACSACHAIGGHEESHAESPTLTGPGATCTECHAANIVTEHLNRGLTCDSCHGATAPLASPVLLSALGMSAFGEISLASEGMESSDVWEAIAAGDTSCTACHASFHGSLLSTSITNPAAPGYLSWDAAASAPGNTGTSPHGGYTSVTNKCAVCHSVHRAVAGGSVLTAYGPYATYAAGCVACHGDTSTFTDVKMTADADGYISPHGTCTRCHTLNPHGAGGSVYPVLASKLLNTSGDAAIAADLSDDDNGLAATMFDGTGNSATGLILGTGYLCASCHQQAFAVNTASTDPASAGNQTGHRVTASATATWDADVYGGSFGRNGTSGDGTKTVAFADAYGCDACHAAPMSDGSSAFPHGYVDATGAVSPKTVAGSSYIWLTAGSYLGSADTTIVATTEPDSPLLLTDDGLCLKCHRGSAANGVGYDF